MPMIWILYRQNWEAKLLLSKGWEKRVGVSSYLQQRLQIPRGGYPAAFALAFGPPRRDDRCDNQGTSVVDSVGVTSVVWGTETDDIDEDVVDERRLQQLIFIDKLPIVLPI